MYDVKFIETVVISGLIAVQLYLAFRLYVKIMSYKSIFSKMPFIAQKNVTVDVYNEGNVSEILSEEDIDDDELKTEIAYLKSTSSNKTVSSISTTINAYLIKNKGASIDFHILKDIADRYIEIVEDEINNRIPAPLYIGLAATMLGIILGLFAINFNVTNDSSSLALEAIKPLIDGVKIAMAASVTGLIITTIFSVSIFKKAKSQVEEGKNEFLSLLQSELLPKMNRSKLPEVHTLSTKLDAFSRNTSSVVSKLDGIVKNSSDAVFREQKLIEQIKSLDVKKVASVNIDVFNQLEGMMDSFQDFAKYYNKLDKSLLNTTELLRNLESFVANTHNINVVLEDIKSNITRSDKATNFFNSHIESFSKYGDAVNEAVANTDSKMSKAIHELVELANKQFESFNEAIAGYDSKLTLAFNKSIENFTQSMDHQVKRTEEVFNTARPKFEKLNKLDKLDDIEKRLINLESKLSDVISSGNKSIVTALNSIKFTTSSKGGTEENLPENLKLSILPKLFIGLKITAYIVVISGGVYYIYMNI
ncbi:hypothetical protein GCM10022271_07770 [Corallibacter vietnamensis]|uniref:MotA/TolQ/ExbB proton channel domain-containing protein n=2 Tax=Corallibacter vietnamensis TaxID=904130 RepID=A0ABP7GYS1_9FLAO